MRSATAPPGKPAWISLPGPTLSCALLGLLVAACGSPAPPPPPPAPPPPPPIVNEAGCDPDVAFAPLPAEYKEDIYATLTAQDPVYDPDDPLEAARVAFKKSQKARAAGDWEAVRRTAQDGWDFIKTPHLAYLLAEAAAHLDRTHDVLRYTAFVLRSQDKNITAEQRAAATRWRAGAAAKIGWLDLQTEPGACLVVDGLNVGLAPLGTPVAVEPGTRRIQAVHQGKRAAEEATVTTGQVKIVTISLR